jgi:DNA-binding beta-propeller fold protein YncE
MSNNKEVQVVRPLFSARFAALFVLFLAAALSVALALRVSARAIAESQYNSVRLLPLSSYTSTETAEIVTFDAVSQQAYVVNDTLIDILDLSDPASPALAGQIDVTAHGAGATSVAFYDGALAVAVAADPAQDAGKIVFFDADGNFLSEVMAGALPDMVTFSPDGKWVLAANEGEPNAEYTVDPEGSVTIIDMSAGAANLTQGDVTQASFTAFNADIDELRKQGVRIFEDVPNVTVATDVEPEYIAVAPDSMTALVTLQENNAVALVDIPGAKVKAILPLGTKDYELPENPIDASDEDGEIQIKTWPAQGMYLPDGIAAFSVEGKTYYITANEGDARDYDGFSEEERVEDLTLDPTAFPNAADLQLPENLGRLKVTNQNGDPDGDGDYDVLYSFGARSFSIWDADGMLVYDSGSQLEERTATLVPDIFNSNGDPDSFDSRSDDKGPEPESVVVGEVDGRLLAFIALERTGGIVVYDVIDPAAPVFVTYQRLPLSDVAPEGLDFVSAADSPNGRPLLLVASEESLTTTVYQIDAVDQLFLPVAGR